MLQLFEFWSAQQLSSMRNRSITSSKVLEELGERDHYRDWLAALSTDISRLHSWLGQEIFRYARLVELTLGPRYQGLFFWD
jgi:hypothetical protein